MKLRVMVCMGLVSLLLGTRDLAAQAAECPPTDAPIAVGWPSEPGLDEISGLAASRQSPGVLWALNDSGPPVIYAITETGTVLARFALFGATLVDWEDLAIGPGPVPDTDYLYIGDIGNNFLARDVVRVYRVAEPVVELSQPFAQETLIDVEAFDLAYPAGAHDCEALVVTPEDGAVYLMTKDILGVDGGFSYIYRNAAPLAPGPPIPLEEVGRVFVGTGLTNMVTAADLAPDGSGLLMRTYLEVLYWPVAFGQPLESAMMALPCKLPSAPEIQSESIAFATDVPGFYTVSEWLQGQPQPIYFYAQPPWEPELDPACGNSTGGFYAVGDRLCLRIPEALMPQPPYQWLRDGEALVNGARIGGAHSRSLVILPLTVADSGAYTCTFSSGAKMEETFGPVQVTVGAKVPVSGALGMAVGAFLMAVLGAYGAGRRAILR